MASGVYNRGKYLLATGTNLASADVRMLMVRTTYTFDNNHNFVSDVVATECDGANYARKTLTTEAVTEDDTNDWAKFTSDNVTWTALGAGATANKGVVLYIYNAADASAALLCYCEFASATNGNGGDFSCQAPSDGWMTLG